MNHTIRIDKIIHGGQGLGRLDSGIVALTDFVLPGEKVLVREEKKQRGYIKTALLEVLSPSPDRIDPPCPYYMQCGGCDLQHMSISSQHEAKENIIKESLKRAGVDIEDSTFNHIVSSPEAFHYRYRLRLKITREGAIGFHQAGSSRIVDITKCLVATDRLNTAIDELRNQDFIKNFARITKEIELLHSPADGLIFCILHPYKETPVSQYKKIGSILSSDFFTGIAVRKGRLVEFITRSKQEINLKQDFPESICGTPFSLNWTPGCFSQVNASQNTRLVEMVCQIAGECNERSVLDLFCGTGNFSIPLALLGAIVTGIEHNTQSVEQAHKNGLKYEINNASFIDQDVNKWLYKAIKRPKEYNIILLDPPRHGMGKDIVLLTELSPEKIIYISCDPATLARDISQLQAHGYMLTSINPVDMFPQTHHIESVALLEKN